MMFSVLLGCILFNLGLIYGNTDRYCYDNCKCCKDGVCETGINGWVNVCTNGCIDRHRAARCYELCQYTNCRHCEGSNIYDNDTTCKACNDGYYLGPNKDCTFECPIQCKSCTSSTHCTECKEGFYKKDGSATCTYALCPEKCECSETKCIACNMGYYNILTNCSSKCPVNCFSCVSKDKCQECTNGFYNGYENDNNISLQLNTCTYRCRDTCTKCQSYNNCSECVSGKYSPTCQKNCSVGCKDRACFTESGNCVCTMNFIGDKCTECVDGKFGQYCNRTCPRYCKDKTCYKNLGYCLDSCISETITGSSCSICIPGKYGELCDETCPKNCEGSQCERYSGICSSGCKGDFTGTFCDQCVHESTNDEQPVTAAVLGSLFAMSVIIILLQGFLMMKQRKSNSRSDARQPIEVTYENQLVFSDVDTPRTGQYGIQQEQVLQSGETNTEYGNEPTVYEVINRDKDEAHDYQQISSTPTTTV